MSFAAEYERLILTATRSNSPKLYATESRPDFAISVSRGGLRVMGNPRRRLKQLEEFSYTRISDYELDKTDPPLAVLVEHARVADVHLEFIVDDRLDLPEILPGRLMYEAWTKPPPKRPR